MKELKVGDLVQQPLVRQPVLMVLVLVQMVLNNTEAEYCSCCVK